MQLAGPGFKSDRIREESNYIEPQQTDTIQRRSKNDLHSIIIITSRC